MEFTYWEDSVSLILKKDYSMGYTTWKVMNAARFFFCVFLIVCLLIYLSGWNSVWKGGVGDVLLGVFFFAALGAFLFYGLTGMILLIVRGEWVWLLGSFLLCAMGGVPGIVAILVYRYLTGKEIRKSDLKSAEKKKTTVKTKK